MARREKSQGGSNSMTVRIEDLLEVQPITKNQELVFEAWDRGDNLVLAGSAGTGKTFLALFMAFEEVLEPDTIYDQVVVIRSMVPTRDMGFLPGTLEEKQDAYTAPYRAICSELFGDATTYNKAISAKKVRFESTSFIRGVTINNSIIVVDEMQNLNFHELDSVITRVGKNTRIIFCGDYRQSDFKWDDDKEGIIKFLNIMEQLKKFSTITFGWEDIVRSDFVRDYIMTKELLNY
jgi:predicted ribonuclease YlaK